MFRAILNNFVGFFLRTEGTQNFHLESHSCPLSTATRHFVDAARVSRDVVK